MTSLYARGAHAIGQCQRCGFVYKRAVLVEDGENGLLVCPTCCDIKHPSQNPVPTAEGIAIYRPAPDLDRAAANAITGPVLLSDAENWPDGSYFGGGT